MVRDAFLGSIDPSRSWVNVDESRDQFDKIAKVLRARFGRGRFFFDDLEDIEEVFADAYETLRCLSKVGETRLNLKRYDVEVHLDEPDPDELRKEPVMQDGDISYDAIRKWPWDEGAALDDERIKKETRDVIEMYVKEIQDNPDDLDVVEQAAVDTAATIDKITVTMEVLIQIQAGGRGSDDRPGEDDDDADGDGNEEGDSPKPIEAPKDDDGENPYSKLMKPHTPEHNVDPSVGWGHMDVKTPVLSKPMPRGAIRARGPTPTDVGTSFRHPHRFFTDKGIFDSQKIRQWRGNVLIDGSGSMSLSDEQIREIMEAAPGCKIAMYSGSGATGTLWVMAKNGLCVKEIPDHPYGNVVDGPALDWLGRQGKGGIWVSDGCVTGTHESTRGELEKDVERKMRKYGIVRLEHVEQAVKYLRSQRGNVELEHRGVPNRNR